MRAAFATALVLLAAGCTAMGESADGRACSSDLDCDEGYICFAEGCGDPGAGIVAEVRGDSKSGLFARDWPIDSGDLGKAQNFALGGPLKTTGEFQRERNSWADPNDRTSYSAPVVLRAVGFSALIPGVSRTYEQRFERPERGRYEMSTGEGIFRMTAWPDDLAVPPATQGDVTVSRDDTPDITFAFPSVDGAVSVSGTLYKRRDAAGNGTAVTGAALDIQAFNSDAREPLSQRFPVSSQGVFTLTLAPEARQLTAVQFVVTPRDASAVLPSRTFTMTAPFPHTLALEYGDPGEPFSVEGQALDVDGAPILRAQVFLQGTTVGGGSFRSQMALTDANGRFTLKALAGAGAQAMTLTVLPPPSAGDQPVRAGLTQLPVTVEAGSGLLSPAVVTCLDRVRVSGQVVDASGAPVPGVAITATEQLAAAERSDQPWLLDPVQALSGPDGSFTLNLDPATWRLEFTARGAPMASRLLTLRAVNDNGERSAVFALPTVRLSQGRAVGGRVTGSVGSKEDAPMAGSRVTFYRATTIEGRPAAINLGSSLTDNDGHYDLLLPTR